MPETSVRRGGSGRARGLPPSAAAASAADVRRRRAAAAAHHVQPALLAEARERAGEHRRASRGTGRPRRAGPRSGTQDIGACAQRRERAEVVGHELRAGRAVEPDREQLRVLERRVERLHALAASIVPIGSMVPETITGTRQPTSRERLLDRRCSAALTLRVSWPSRAAGSRRRPRAARAPARGSGRPARRR